MPNHFRCDSPMCNGRPARRLHSIDDDSAESSSNQQAVVDAEMEQETLHDDDAQDARSDHETLVVDDHDDDVGPAVVLSSPNPVYVAGSVGANSPVMVSSNPGLGFHERETVDGDSQSEARQTETRSNDSAVAHAGNSVSDTTAASIAQDQDPVTPALPTPRQKRRARRAPRLPSSRLDVEQIEWAKRVRGRLARYLRESADRGDRFAGCGGRRRMAGKRWVEEGISPIEMVLGRRRSRRRHGTAFAVTESARPGGRDDARRASRSRHQCGCVWSAEQAYREDLRVAADSEAAERAIRATERFLAGGVAETVR
ncbi:hypothetical protein EJ03DRAFT_347153 [Teratosphaeria nubilosa]|uniref:Uncharacterized protein n=1 Tax=Teratosphaeria nubilosa TaxID=161662 RepID=A0A6G1LPN6_9PEZI|nr:hypothetical protein EJ03DRAFT_347153 [Teratosphaeria nubilosa]